MKLPYKLPHKANGPLIVLAGIIWIFAIGLGIRNLSNYEWTAIRSKMNSPNHWPEQSKLKLNKERFNLILFLHPKCPCSRATIEELSSILNASHEKLHVYVLFCDPMCTDESWVKTDLWEKAKALTNIQVWIDKDGEECERFCVTGSGSTLLYDEDGRLRFQGGITLSRGHIGENPGASAIVSILENKKPYTVRTPVFGCTLFGSSPLINQDQAKNGK